MRIEFKKEIDNIRAMLSHATMHEIYDKMISLNEFDVKVDDYVGRIKGAKCPFDLQFLTWEFS